MIFMLNTQRFKELIILFILMSVIGNVRKNLSFLRGFVNRLIIFVQRGIGVSRFRFLGLNGHLSPETALSFQRVPYNPIQSWTTTRTHPPHSSPIPYPHPTNSKTPYPITQPNSTPKTTVNSYD